MMRLLLLSGVLLLLVACRSEQKPLPPSDELASQARVMVTGTGLFKVTPDTLASLGWNDETPLTLTMNEELIGYQRHEGALFFYLPERVYARYSNQHALWLRRDEASQEEADPSTGSGIKPDETPLTTVIAERRLTGYDKYNSNYVGDPWFWRTLLAPANETHEVNTPGRQAGSVVVTVRAAGSTKVMHKLTVALNDQEVGTLEWSGQTRHEESFTVELPAGEMIAINLEVPQGEGGFDISLLDEVIVHYPSQPLATEGVFKGMASASGVAQFDQLSDDIVAWQIEPKIRLLPTGSEGVFLPAKEPVVVIERELAQPTSVERVENTEIAREGADYVAIVVPELAEATEPLLAFHREQGLSTVTFSPQQVYDAYSAGTVDPLAIRTLLAEAEKSWKIKPRFVLLVGDSTYDPAGYQHDLPPTYLPSPFINTVFGGETVSDNLIADIDEDGYPDMALGRLPARSTEQLETIINKIIDYSQKPASGDWQERVLFTADGREDLFKNTSEQLRTDLADNINAVTVYPEAASDPMSQILPALNEGSLIVNYIGHGSVQQWGRDQLLTVDVASELNNGQRLPVFINMTCLTGLFSHPSEESLAETLLWAQNGGAIAAIAPSSLTLPNNQKPLNAALLKELLSTENLTVGEALMRAKQSVPLGNNNQQDIVATFNLLGDPALLIGKNKSSTKEEAKNETSHWTGRSLFLPRTPSIRSLFATPPHRG